MIKINSLSGGQTSSYIAAKHPADFNVFALVRIEDQKCKFPDKKIRQEVEDRIQAPFIATAEDDLIVYTMLDLEQFIGQRIHWVTGKTFEQSIKGKGQFLPNKMVRYCTTDLKTLPIAQWRYEKIKGDVSMRFGYRANETKRARKMMDKLNENGMTEVKIISGKSKSGRNKWKTIEYCRPEFPLIKDAIFKDDIQNFWKDKPVRFAYMNNCIGCFWRSPVLLKKMADKHPKKMAWFSQMEQTTGNAFRSDLTYSEIINWKTQIELFDDDFNSCDSGYCGL